MNGPATTAKDTGERLAKAATAYRRLARVLNEPHLFPAQAVDAHLAEAERLGREAFDTLLDLVT